MKLLLKETLRSYVAPRRFQAYCIGLPKSGTHSIAGLFHENFRSQHEPELAALRKVLIRVQQGEMSPAQLTQYLKTRDKRLWLELDSSPLNSFLAHILIREFDAAKFILTIRDCYSWIVSIINHRVTRTRPAEWRDLQVLRYRTSNFHYSPEEEYLRLHQLPSIDAYLEAWCDHHRRMLELVPSHRLLIIKTNEISEKVQEIAQFLNIAPKDLQVSNAHLFQAKKKLPIFEYIDREFIERKVNSYCYDMMNEFFPDHIDSGKMR